MMRIVLISVGLALAAGGPALAQATPAPRNAGATEERPAGGLTAAEIRELLASSAATAKATREAVDYSRVMPDLLTQILAKLDKIEDKLGKLEADIEGGQRAGARRR